MAWKKKQIDKSEMLHILGLIYAKTSTGFQRVGLKDLISEQGKSTIRGKRDCIVRALIKNRRLLCEGITRDRKYKWNMKEYGPVSIPMAEEVILEAERQKRLDERERRERKRLKDSNVKKEMSYGSTSTTVR